MYFAVEGNESDGHFGRLPDVVTPLFAQLARKHLHRLPVVEFVAEPDGDLVELLEQWQDLRKGDGSECDSNE